MDLKKNFTESNNNNEVRFLQIFFNHLYLFLEKRPWIETMYNWRRRRRRGEKMILRDLRSFLTLLTFFLICDAVGYIDCFIHLLAAHHKWQHNLVQSIIITKKLFTLKKSEENKFFSHAVFIFNFKSLTHSRGKYFWHSTYVCKIIVLKSLVDIFLLS